VKFELLCHWWGFP